LADLIVDGKNIKSEFKAVQCSVEGVSGFVWLRMGDSGISYEDSMEHLGPVKVEELFYVGWGLFACLELLCFMMWQNS
jgi:hypothetical protein